MAKRELRTQPAEGHLEAARAPEVRQRVVRKVKSFRIRDDLAHRVEILAARERRKIYEVVEEALEDYLFARRDKN